MAEDPNELEKRLFAALARISPRPADLRDTDTYLAQEGPGEPSPHVAEQSNEATNTRPQQRPKPSD